MPRIAFHFPLALIVSLASATDFLGTPRCGDCWCIPDDGATCPTDTTGIADSFSETDQNFSTFVLKKRPGFLKLQSYAGGDCFPFKDSLGVIDDYLESDQDQCVYPEEDDKTVCGYVYDTTSTMCKGRKYSIQNFAGANDAMGSNAHIVHKGCKLNWVD